MDVVVTPRMLHAPTRGMGLPRRRSFARIADGQVIIGPAGAVVGIVATLVTLLLAVALTVAGCVAERPSVSEPISTALTGDVIRTTVPGGPPIECRHLPCDRCLGPGSIEGPVGDIEHRRIARVVVSCVGRTCDAAGGSMRVDLVLSDGLTVEVARGGYGTLARP